MTFEEVKLGVSTHTIVLLILFQVMLRDLRGGEADFNAAIDLSPKSAHIFFNRANLYAFAGNYAKAEADYTTGLLACVCLNAIERRAFPFFVESCSHTPYFLQRCCCSRETR